MATIVLAGLLALPGTALAKYDMNGGGGTEATIDRELSTNEQIIADTWKSLVAAGLTDELSANERIIADAWKSHLHARKAAALLGLG